MAAHSLVENFEERTKTIERLLTQAFDLFSLRIHCNLFYEQLLKHINKLF